MPAQPEAELLPPLPLRLDTVLRRAGRKHLLQQGRVTVTVAAAAAASGSSSAPAAPAPAPDAALLIFPTDRVNVDGEPLPELAAAPGRVYALHKPRGMEVTMAGASDLGRWLCSLDERKGTDEATTAWSAELSYVGRLDKQTSGLLLATDDGDLCSLLCESPHCAKTYIATVRCRDALQPTPAQAALAVAGVELSADSNSSRANSSSEPPVAPQTYMAAALSCTVMKRSRREFTSTNGGGKAKETKSKKKKKKKRKESSSAESAAATATAQAPDSDATGAGSDAAADGTTGVDAAAATAAAAAPTVHVNFEAEVEVVINTGQYRVVRRLLAAVGLPVLQLRRTAVGCVSFTSLAAAGAALENPRESVRVPPQLVDELWRSVGGVQAVWQRRLRALQAQCRESDDEVAAAGEAERARLREWLHAHNLLSIEGK